MAYIDRYGVRQEGTGGFVDYYSGKPTNTGTTGSSSTETISPVIETPIDPRYMLKPTESNVETGPSEEEQYNTTVGLNGIMTGNVDYNLIEYETYDDYIKSTPYTMDRSGGFSVVNFGETNRGTAKGFAVTEALMGGLPIAGPLIDQFDVRAVDSPIGQVRFSQQKGIGNFATTYNLSDEYEGLNQIKNDKANFDPLVAGFDTGYAFTTGNKTGYRLKGSSLYKGLPSGMTQATAKDIEALQQGYNPYTYNSNSENNETIVSADAPDGTLKGGYTLDGKFYSPGTGVAAYGWMDDFTNMARNNFASGNLTKVESEKLARGWLESSRNGNFKNMKEKLDNLNAWKNRAKKEGAMTPKEKLKEKNNKWKYKKKKVVSEGNKTVSTQQNYNRTKGPSGGAADIAAQASYVQSMQDSGGGDYSGYGDGSVADAYDDPNMYQGGQVGMAEGDQVAPEMQEGTMVEPSIEGQDDGDMILSANELLEGEPESGFIRKPASETTDEEGVTDNNPTLAPNEKNPRGAAIVINKQAVDQMGEQDAVKMIEEARAYLRSKGGEEANLDENNPEGMSEIITADGEIMIQPEEADVIGRKRLLALNERGKGATRAVKKKVKPKQEGFITANEGLEVSSINPDRFSKVWNEYKPLIRGGTQAENNNKSRDKAQRLLKQFTDQELLAFVMLSEGSTLGEEGAEGIAHIILNRINSEEKDFKKIEDVYSAITKRQKGKEGNRVFQFQGLEPTPIKKYLRLLNEKDPETTKKYKQYVNIADEVIAGAREDFTNNSTFFWDPRNSTDPFMLKSVKSGSLIAQGSTKVGNFLHQYLKMAGENKQSTMPNEKEIIREGQYTAMTENYMNRVNKNQPTPNVNAQSQGGGFISRYNDNRAKPLVALN
jgi:hypothetical protein